MAARRSDDPAAPALPQGCPAKPEGSAMNGKTGEVAIKTFEISHDVLEIEQRRLSREAGNCSAPATKGAGDSYSPAHGLKNAHAFQIS